jgi:hypothetical protein
MFPTREALRLKVYKRLSSGLFHCLIRHARHMSRSQARASCLEHAMAKLLSACQETLCLDVLFSFTLITTCSWISHMTGRVWQPELSSFARDDPSYINESSPQLDYFLFLIILHFR